MTYIEVVILISERGEKVVSDRLSSIQTDKHLYTRGPTGDWEARESIPPVIEEKFAQIPVEIPVAKKKS